MTGVAPRAGARIETFYDAGDAQCGSLRGVAPRAGARIETFERQQNATSVLVSQVAPRAGARIETWPLTWALAATRQGRPPCGGAD